MSYENMSPADYAAVNGRNNGGWGGEWSMWIIIFLIFAMFGWGGNGFGGFGNRGAAEGYTLASDFATIQRQLSDGFGGVEKGIDTIRSGICDGFYTEAQLVNGVNMNIMQGNNALQAQLAAGFCGVNGEIKDNRTQGIMNTNAIQQQIQQCCCDVEKMSMQNRFDAQAYNCETLKAIDKVGDRIIDYMAAEKTQALRDENQALRLAASQARQNEVLINTLRPMPVPAYQSCNPWAATYGACGCNYGCA